MRQMLSYMLFFVVLGFRPLLAATPTEVLNFQEWRAQRIYDAELQLEKDKSRHPSGPSASESTAKEYAGRVQSRDAKASDALEEAQRNLKLAKELSAVDYFQLYLRFQSPEAIKDISEKLSKKELAEILATIKAPMVGGGSTPTDGARPSM